MSLKLAMLGGLVALSLGACTSSFTGYSATGGKPMGAASTAPGQASQMPQSPNSLPAGDAVSAPVDTNVGRVGVTRY